MIELVLFVLLALLVLVLFEVRARKEQKSQAQSVSSQAEGECCGQHLVCERETLLQTNAQIVYYDDEELDVLADIPVEELTDKQAAQIREVFCTLQPHDVAGWCRSMQLRNISLPLDVREEALMIVRDLRNAKNIT